jgi:hypothetical protein
MISHTAEPAVVADIESQINLARQAAIEVFGNCVAVELVNNPECPGESWYDVSVNEAVENGDYKSVVQRQLRWHQRLRELIPEIVPDRVPDFRLSLIIAP